MRRTGLLGNSCALTCVENKTPTRSTKLATGRRIVSPPPNSSRAAKEKAAMSSMVMRNAAMQHGGSKIELVGARAGRCRQMFADLQAQTEAGFAEGSSGGALRES